MLGKLLKHEFKNTGKLLLPLNLALIGVTLIGMIVLGLKVFDNGASGIIAATLVVFYILAIIALFIVTYVFLMINFYRSMYSAQGYLTHTLPVSPLLTLNTKLFVSTIWACLTMILTICSVVTLVITAVKTYSGPLDFSNFFSEFETSIGLSFGASIAWILLFIVLSCLSGLLMIYASISIGQLFNKYKILAAIVTYVIFYIIMQIVSTIIVVKTSIDSVTSSPIVYSKSTTLMQATGLDKGFVPSTLIQTGVYIIIFYAITAYISSKKVNLD